MPLCERRSVLMRRSLATHCPAVRIMPGRRLGPTTMMPTRMRRTISPRLKPTAPTLARMPVAVDPGGGARAQRSHGLALSYRSDMQSTLAYRSGNWSFICMHASRALNSRSRVSSGFSIVTALAARLGRVPQQALLDVAEVVLEIRRLPRGGDALVVLGLRLDVAVPHADALALRRRRAPTSPRPTRCSPSSP